MTRVAIKNMTEEQARNEDRRIDQRLYELRQQLWVLDAKADHLDVFCAGWMRRISRISQRLLDLGVGQQNTEISELHTARAKIFERWKVWLDARNAVYAEKAPIRKEMAGLYKRTEKVTKRRWHHNYARLGPVTEQEYLRSLD
jgi:hypothetical protein